MVYPEWIVWVPFAILGLIFAWLVPAKCVTRACRAAGVSTPCPFWLGWILWLRPGRWFRRRIIDRIGIRAGERVLEIGCGVGVFTAISAERVGQLGHLSAIDVQHQMVNRTRNGLAATTSKTVEVRVADARTLPFEAGSFDRVFLVSAFPEMSDRQQVLDAIHDVLRPGGVLSISEEFFDPEYRFPGETRQIVQRAGRFRCRERLGSWLMYTMNFERV